MRQRGAMPAPSLEELVGLLVPPRAVWIMIPAAAVDGVIAVLTPRLAAGDTAAIFALAEHSH